MTAPNVQRFVKQKWMVIVTRLNGAPLATISVGQPNNPSMPRKMSIQPLLAAGLDEREALEYVADIVEIAVEAVAT